MVGSPFMIQRKLKPIRHGISFSRKMPVNRMYHWDASGYKMTKSNKKWFRRQGALLALKLPQVGRFQGWLALWLNVTIEGS